MTDHNDVKGGGQRDGRAGARAACSASVPESAARKLRETPRRLPLARDAGLLLRFLRATVTGRYKGVPWYALSVAAGALMYFVNTLDAVPDVVPFGGLADDALVLTAAVAALQAELVRFKRWERREKSP